MSSQMLHRTGWVVGIVLAVAVGGVLPARGAEDPPADYAQLERQLFAAYQAKDYEKAMGIAEKMLKLRPDSEDTLYNMACLHCLMGHKDKAYESLERAIKAGYDDAAHLAEDADFKTIRGEDRFRAILKRLREKSGDDGDDEDEPEPKAGAKPRDGDDDEEEDEDEPPAKGKAKGDDDDDEDDADDEEEDDDDGEMTEQEKAQEIGRLTQQLVAAAEAGDYDKALKAGLKAHALAEELGMDRARSLTNYNLACMYSLKKDKDKAFEHLEKAAELRASFPDPRGLAAQMKGDSDLDNLRKDPRYGKIWAKVSGEARGGGGAAGKPAAFKYKVTLPKKLDRSKKAPLLVALHGAGGNMDETAERWKKAAEKAGAILLTPQGTLEVGEKKYRWAAEVSAVERELMKAIEKAMDEHPVNRDKVVLAGFSQGAGLTWSLALRNPDTFCGIIPVCGRVKAESESAFEDEDLKQLRVCVLLGEDDDDEMRSANKDAARRLEKHGCKVRVKEYESVGHAFPDDFDREGAEALKFVLGK